MRRRTAIILAIVPVVAAGAATLIWARVQQLRLRSSTLHGAVIRRDTDTRRQQPVSGVAVTISDGTVSATTQSDAAGYFQIVYPRILWPGKTFDLSFRRDGYMPLDLTLHSGLRFTTRELYVAAMSPIQQVAPAAPNRKPSAVTNVKVRYTVNSETVDNVGSAVRTFEVENKGNTPCNRQQPCSPDGNWKAASGSISLDAGPGNVFRDVRASCIAGPCPFTTIDSSGYINGGRNVTATAIDWSDTATFLVEAEVFRDNLSSSVRQLYPVIFGETLHFTLPPTQEGVSIEAEIDGTPMVFPLGPDLYLSWATCTQRASADAEKATVFRCELKPGYKF